MDHQRPGRAARLRVNRIHVLGAMAAGPRRRCVISREGLFEGGEWGTV
jgi:hypothetical protein